MVYMRVTKTVTVTATGPGAEDWWSKILLYWWLIAGAGILGLIVVGGSVAYQKAERQKLLALGRRL